MRWDLPLIPCVFEISYFKRGDVFQAIFNSCCYDMVFVLIEDADIVVCPCFGKVEEWCELRNEIHIGCVVAILVDEHTLLPLKENLCKLVSLVTRCLKLTFCPERPSQ